MLPQWCYKMTQIQLDEDTIYLPLHFQNSCDSSHWSRSLFFMMIKIKHTTMKNHEVVPAAILLHQSVIFYKNLRVTSAPLLLGIALPTSSSFFRMPATDLRTQAKCWDNCLSTESHNCSVFTLKASAKSKKSSRVISLSTGCLASQYLPWTFMAFGSWDAKHHHHPNISINKSDGALAMPALMTCCSGEIMYDLEVALNYSYTAGSSQLLCFLTEHTEMIHQPLYHNWETCTTCGSTAVFEMLLCMLCNRGDWIVAEKHTYSGAIKAVKLLGLNVLNVQMDKILVPEDLDSKLRAWDTSVHAKPSVLYTIPSDQNLTGRTRTVERRRAIYCIAEEHDLIIIENDLYYFLQLEGSEAPLAPMMQNTYWKILSPSYLSLNVSDRMLRLNSISKILAPELQCEWLTGCFQLIAKFLNHTEFSIMSLSRLLQIMLYKLFDKSWDHEDFIVCVTIQWSQELSAP